MDNESMMALSKQLEVEFDSLVENCLVSGAIDLNLYQEYDVKRGLRDSSGKGVLTGLTEISDVTGYDVVNGVKEPADGKLFYQGYDVKNLVGYGIKKKFAFEETTYLLLFGKASYSRAVGSVYRDCRQSSGIVRTVCKRCYHEST